MSLNNQILDDRMGLTGVVVEVEISLALDVVPVGVLVVRDAEDTVDGVAVVLRAGRVRDDADAARLLRTAAVHS